MTMPDANVVHTEAPTKVEVASNEAKAPAVEVDDDDEERLLPFKRATPAAVTAAPPARRPSGVEMSPILRAKAAEADKQRRREREEDATEKKMVVLLLRHSATITFISSRLKFSLNMPLSFAPRAALLPRRAPPGATAPRAEASTSAAAAPARAGGPRRQLPSPPKQTSSSSSKNSTSSSTSTSSTTTAPKRKPFTRAPDLPSRLAELQELVRDLAGVAASAGPRSAFRGIQAADAVARVGRQVLREALRPGGKPPSAPAFLRRVFEALGATYIKLGQFIASSPSLFPEEYVTEFEALLDRTEPVPWKTIEASIERELGGPLGRFFESVDEAPLASASVAQVHAAVLKGSRADVVVKVRKPGVDATLAADLGFLYAAARVAEFLSPALGRGSVAAIAADIRSAMLDEVDFTKEADHVAEFASYLRATGMEALATCPVVYREASSTGVLTMSRLRGVPLTDVEAIRSITDVEPEAVLVGALNAWFGSLLAARSFHADVHSGNLLALPDGRVGFIDFGIVGRVAPSTWAAVRALVASTASGDYNTMARALAAMGALGEEKQRVTGGGGDDDEEEVGGGASTSTSGFSRSKAKPTSGETDDGELDYSAFAADLEAVFKDAAAAAAATTVTVVPVDEATGRPVVGPSASAEGQAAAAAVSFDEAAVNRLLLSVVRVGETYGIRFPREFGILLKQLLYFDRYIRILAPGLNLADDSRVGLDSIESRFGGTGGVDF